MEAQLHLILALAISAGQWSALCPCCYSADTPQIGGLGGWLFGQEKNPLPLGGIHTQIIHLTFMGPFIANVFL